jgi:hypothetical protein
MLCVHACAYLLTAGILEPQDYTVARQRLGKQVSMDLIHTQDKKNSWERVFYAVNVVANTQ